MMESPLITFVGHLKLLLTEQFPHIACESLEAHTHLIFDLGLDSVELMRLLVLLETEYGYSIPDAVLDRDAMETVADLERMLGQVDSAVGEPELDVKVHCVVSCLCHPIKKAGLDHRPMYFGVWDAEVFVNDDSQLRYHSDDVNHGRFFEWFSQLYGATAQRWYDEKLSKTKNIALLEDLINTRSSSQQVMIMLDMYRLPERENRFKINPFPHYVLLEQTGDPEQLWMWDPDFRWEGALDRKRVLYAVESPAANGGYLLDTKAVVEPCASDVAGYFEACFSPDHNNLTDAVEQVLFAYRPGSGGEPGELSRALAELPILAIRKYAYEHGFAYFWRALGRSEKVFDYWCDHIEILVRGFDRLLFEANRYALSQKTSDWERICGLIKEQNSREFHIKDALYDAYKSWSHASFARHCPAATSVDV